eukprot:TRINITY_DN16475_c0_g1_i2.p1 TRINITY_DN16475_c0_g1~~TRINITY_DN16475_c0_g1_i2.p1  ORF type:complete len:229 (-),score=40.28 TRINITY_DN16475_c0_g1_i2:139-825(-)
MLRLPQHDCLSAVSEHLELREMGLLSMVSPVLACVMRVDPSYWRHRPERAKYRHLAASERAQCCLAATLGGSPVGWWQCTSLNVVGPRGMLLLCKAESDIVWTVALLNQGCSQVTPPAEFELLRATVHEPQAPRPWELVLDLPDGVGIRMLSDDRMDLVLAPSSDIGAQLGLPSGGADVPVHFQRVPTHETVEWGDAYGPQIPPPAAHFRSSEIWACLLYTSPSPRDS